MPRRRAALAAAACAAVGYAAVFADLWLRARAAYLEGEKYLLWHREPARKAAFFDAALKEKSAAVERDRGRGALTAEEAEARLMLLKSERDWRVSESSLKYAHAWFRTAVELFSPPESRWVRLSRQKLAETRALWEGELREKKIPFQNYMLE